MNNVELTLRDWLGRIGLHFDPLLPLDAAQDSRLSEYRVGHSTFGAVWGDWVSFVFAPPGGGKTALRVNTAQACWVGQSTNRPFAMSYIPPYVDRGHVDLTWEEHLTALCQSASQELFLALAYRPHWLFDLDRDGLRAVRQALDWNLPGPLPGYLAQCVAMESLRPLCDAFDPTLNLPDPPDRDAVLRFCAQLGAIDPGPAPCPAPLVRWQHLTHLLLDTLAFRALYVLIDSLDGVAETADDPVAAIGSIAQLLEQSGAWGEQRIFLKGFFPSETRPVLEREFPAIPTFAHLVTIQWTPALLAEVIRRRLYVASDGAYNSLNAVGAPSLPGNVELLLAEMVAPLPRELLVLTREVFRAHVARWGADFAALEIELEDIDRAVDTYRQNLPTLDLATPFTDAETQVDI